MLKCTLITPVANQHKETNYSLLLMFMVFNIIEILFGYITCRNNTYPHIGTQLSMESMNFVMMFIYMCLHDNPIFTFINKKNMFS